MVSQCSVQKLAVVSATALVIFGMAQRVEGEITTWAHQVSGLWIDGANWDTGSAPTFRDDVELGLTGAYTSSLTIRKFAASLDISNPDATLAILDSAKLIMKGTLNNDGIIVVNPLQGESVTTLTFDSSNILTGTGTLILSSPGDRSTLATKSSVILTHEASHTVQGQGLVEAELLNFGVFSANVKDGEMVFAVNEKTNHATFEARNGSAITIADIVVTQGPDGVISAQGIGSRIRLEGASVVGGSIRALNGEVIIIDSPVSLSDVRFEGGLEVVEGNALGIDDSALSNSVIGVNSSMGAGNTGIVISGEVSLEGNGRLILGAPGERALITGSTLNQGPGHRIEGQGQIHAQLFNDGVVSANVPGAEMILSGSWKVNNGLIEAIDGGTMNIHRSGILQSGEGTMLADGLGSLILVDRGTISSGKLGSANGGLVRIEGDFGNLDGVELFGDITTSFGCLIMIDDGLVNEGDFVVSYSELEFSGSPILSGNGRLILDSDNFPGLRSEISLTTSANHMTQESSHRIEGVGIIKARMINEGVISANVAGKVLMMASWNHTNHGVIEAVSGGVMSLMGNITIDQRPAGVIVADGAGSTIELNGSQFLILGGTLETKNDARVVSNAGVLEGVEFAGLLEIPSLGALYLRNGVVNNGLINAIPEDPLGALLYWDEDFMLEGNGTVRLSGVGTHSRILRQSGVEQIAFGAGQRLEGVGEVWGNMEINGTLAPGLSIGMMRSLGIVQLTQSSHFEVEVNGDSGDIFESTSEIHLDGTIDVLFVDGFEPAGYWSRSVMLGSSIFGMFDTVNMPSPAQGYVNRVLNTGAELVVGQTCLADMNIDGQVDFFDISVFLQGFGNSDSNADFTGDGVWDFFDVSAFLQAFSAGCP